MRARLLGSRRKLIRSPLELFMDDMPTFSYHPAVYYYEGRVREGLKSPDFAEFYRTYVKIRNESAEDPIVAEIHRQLGK